MTDTYQIHIARKERPIVSIDRFELAAGKLTFLFGESGIGKSMISKAIYGLLDPAELDITINGEPYRHYLNAPTTRELQQHGFFVFQEPSSHLNPLMRLADQLREGSLARAANEAGILRQLWEGRPGAAVQEILAVYPKPYRPSGGEKQRILLAMAFKKLDLFLRLPSRPENHLFVFDEPTGSLDNYFRNLFLRLLLDHFRQRPFTGILITHDYSIISEIFERHRDVTSRLVFKALVAEDGRVHQRNFAPTEYLNWLKQEKTATFVRGRADKTVLQMKSGYRVFNRAMSFSRRRGRGKIIRQEFLEIKTGEMVYVKAPSGEGKTTLAKIIMGLQRCAGLQLTVAGHRFTDATPPAEWRRKMWGKTAGMVFQHADEALNLNATIREVFGGLPIGKSLDDAAITRHLLSLFDQVIDEAFLHKKLFLLSGGQKQRLNLLRTLALNTDLLILDEPFNGLDLESIQKVIALLQEKLRKGVAILMISHNEEIVESIVPPAGIYHLHAEAESVPG